MARRQRRTRPARRLILDSGAVIALSRNDERARAALRAAIEADVDVSIPAVVVAETIRDRNDDAPVHRVVRAVGFVTPVDEAIGRVAGPLLGATDSDATIDAIVVATAIVADGAVVLTSDPDELEQLAADHPSVRVQPL